MLEIRGSKTEENLKRAFADEAQGSSKYTYYAEQVRRDGYGQIGNIFDEIAENEREHAKLWYKLLNGGIGTTEENLETSVNGEQNESSETYIDYANTAREEGLDEIAELFERVALIENGHNMTFEVLLDKVKNGTVFSREEEIMWKCMICGYTETGNDAPQMCPVCGYGQEFFEAEDIM